MSSAGGFVFAFGGNDTLNAGADNDYLDGGNDADVLNQTFPPQAASR